MRLPADYVAEHVELAYAETSHASQGRTVDRSFVLLDGPTDARGIYVPMTRGRHSNEVFAVLDGEQSASDVVADALARDWIDQPALSRRAELQQPTSQPSGTGSVQRPLEPSTLRFLLDQAHALAHQERRADVEVGMLTRKLNANDGRRQQLARSLAADRDRLEQAERTLEQLDRPMCRRRHRAEIDAAIGQIRRLPAAIERSLLELVELDAKEVVDRQRLVIAKEAVGNRGDVLAERLSVDFQLDLDVKARAALICDDPPGYLIDRLGQRPFAGAGADLWDRAAGAIDQHRTAFGIEGPSLLGRQPRWDDGAYATSHKAAASAAERLDRALGRTIEREPPGRELGLSL